LRYLRRTGNTDRRKPHALFAKTSFEQAALRSRQRRKVLRWKRSETTAGEAADAMTKMSWRPCGTLSEEQRSAPAGQRHESETVFARRKAARAGAHRCTRAAA